MSKRRRNGIIVLSLLFVVLLVWLDHGAAARRWRHRLSSQDSSQADQEKYHARTFKVVDVVDGDTLDIDVPDGANKCTRIRLLGIDAPETRSERSEPMYFGPEATEFATDLMLGQSVTVYLDAPNPTRGKYGRLLAYVRLPDGRFANEVLVAEGFAYADTRFDHSLFNKYRQLEAGARSRAKGLWPSVTPNQFPVWRREKTDAGQAQTPSLRQAQGRL
ncbi:MAG TPA: thermonuclease family protein [Sedimentisphaerales bacterium]|nr:thermonuclease family protein [Sedimentisphaerales bacterium]